MDVEVVNDFHESGFVS